MPTSKCFVKGCQNGLQHGIHYLPRNIDFRNRWFQALGYISFSTQEFVCSDHFTDDDFIQKTSKKKRLKKAAVPSRNLFLDNNVVPEDSGIKLTIKISNAMSTSVNNHSEIDNAWSSCSSYSNCGRDQETGESLCDSRKRSVDWELENVIVSAKRRHIDFDLAKKNHNIRHSLVVLKPDLLNVLDLSKAKVNFERISFYFEPVFQKMEIARTAIKASRIKAQSTTSQDDAKKNVSRGRLSRKAKPLFFVESSDDDDDVGDNNAGSDSDIEKVVSLDIDDDWCVLETDSENSASHSKRSKVCHTNLNKMCKTYACDEEFMPPSVVEKRRKVRRSSKRNVISDIVNCEAFSDSIISGEVKNEYMSFSGVDYCIIKKRIQMSKWCEDRFQQCEIISRDDSNFLEAQTTLGKDAGVDACSLLDFEEGFVTQVERDWLLLDSMPNDLILACRFCSHATRCFRTMQHHIFTAHLGIRDCKCIHCGKCFSRLSSLLLHYWQQHPTVGIAFRAAANYIVVQVIPKNGDSEPNCFKCPYCNFESHRINNARNHVSLCMRLWQTRTCPACHILLPVCKTRLSTYLDEKCGEKDFSLSSDDINIFSSTIYSLVDHLAFHKSNMLAHVQNNDTVLKCAGVLCHICNAESDEPLAPIFLELHFALHDNEVRVRCGECSLQLPRNWARLHLHYQLTHPEVNERRFIDANMFALKCANQNELFSCPYCGLVGKKEHVKLCLEANLLMRPLPPVAAAAHCSACNLGAADNFPVSFINNLAKHGGLLNHIQVKHKFCLLCLRTISCASKSSAGTVESASSHCCSACGQSKPNWKKTCIEKRSGRQELAAVTAAAINNFVSRGLSSSATQADDTSTFLLCQHCEDKKGVLPATLSSEEAWDMVNHLWKDDHIEVHLRCPECPVDALSNKNTLNIFKSTSAMRKHYRLCHPKQRKPPSHLALLISQLEEQKYVKVLSYKEVERRRRSSSVHLTFPRRSTLNDNIFAALSFNSASMQSPKSAEVDSHITKLKSSFASSSDQTSIAHKFLCLKCGRKFKTWQSMRIHVLQEPCALYVRLICPLKKIHGCPDFKTEKVYRDHMASHTRLEMQAFVRGLPPTPTLRCMLCFAFDTHDLRLLVTHLEGHFCRPLLINCIFCPYLTCCNTQSFYNHARLAHPELSEEIQNGKLGFHILNQHRVLVRLRSTNENIGSSFDAFNNSHESSTTCIVPSLDFGDDDMSSPVTLQEVVVEFYCAMCLKVHGSTDRLCSLDCSIAVLNHYHFEHPKLNLRYTCEICQTVCRKNSEAREGFFRSVQELHSHVWAKHGREGLIISKTAQFLCLNRSRCSTRLLRNVADLLNHVLNQHRSEVDQSLLYYCPMCPWLRAKHVEYIIAHQRVEHHEIEPLMQLGFGEPRLQNENALFQRRFSSETVSSEIAALVPSRYSTVYCRYQEIGVKERPKSKPRITKTTIPHQNKNKEKAVISCQKELQCFEEPTYVAESHCVDEPACPAETQCVDETVCPAEKQCVEEPACPAETQCVEEPACPAETQCVDEPACPAETQCVDEPACPAKAQCVDEPACPAETHCVQEPEFPAEKRLVEETESQPELQCEDKVECPAEAHRVEELIIDPLTVCCLEKLPLEPGPVINKIQNEVIVECFSALDSLPTSLNNSISAATHQDFEPNNVMLDLIIKKIANNEESSTNSDYKSAPLNRKISSNATTLVSTNNFLNIGTDLVSASLTKSIKECGALHVGAKTRKKTNISSNDMVVPLASGPIVFLDNCWTHHPLPMFEHRLLTDSKSEALLIDGFSAFNLLSEPSSKQRNTSVSCASTTTFFQTNKLSVGSGTPQTQLLMQQKSQPSPSNASNPSSQMRFASINSIGGIISGSNGLPSLEIPASMYLSSPSAQSAQFCPPSYFQNQPTPHQIAQNCLSYVPTLQASRQNQSQQYHQLSRALQSTQSSQQLQTQVSKNMPCASQLSQPHQYSASLSNASAAASAYLATTSVDALMVAKFQQQSAQCNAALSRDIINAASNSSLSNQLQDFRDGWFPHENSLASVNNVVEQVQPPPYYHTVGTTASVVYRK